jgi:hypothetical protein
MITPDINILKGPQFTEKYFCFHYPEFLTFLNEKYKDTQLTFQEKLYWYFNNINEYPTCKCCGKRTKFENVNKGYRIYCSYKCLNSDPDKKKKVEETCLEKFGTKAPAQNRLVLYKMEQTNLKKYGVKNAMQNDDIAKKSHKNYIDKYGGIGNASEIVKEKYKETSRKRYGVNNYASTSECREKMKETCLNKYSVDSFSKTEEFKEKIINHNLKKYGVNSYTQTDEYKEKTLNTNMIKFGKKHYSKTNEYKERTKQTCMEKYGVNNYSKTKEFLQRCHDTKKQNGTFNSSSIEESFAEWLVANNIAFERQHRSDKYPFNCDFYFPGQDLYFEIQGSWTHGPEPYDVSNPDHQEILEEMMDKASTSEYYENAITVWTVKDPIKRETAKKNNLNWVEVFSCNLDEVIDSYKDAINH